jgi:RNA polymerase primary sigma factor
MTAKKAAKKAEPATLDADVTEKKAKTEAKTEAKTRVVKAKEADPADAAATEPKKRGRKPKAVTAEAAPAKKEAAKKASFDEDDVGDIEAEVEADLDVGEPEVVEEAGDDKPKAKPLRMKVSRAKERALMREFGIDDTTLTEDEVNKRRQDLKTLIKLGKTRGFLTHQEINDHLPEKLVENEILEAIISMLNDMGVAVYEQAPDAATLLINNSAQSTATEEEAEEAAEAALSTVDSEFGRTTDPVRMYMRKWARSSC